MLLAILAACCTNHKIQPKLWQLGLQMVAKWGPIGSLFSDNLHYWCQQSSRGSMSGYFPFASQKRLDWGPIGALVCLCSDHAEIISGNAFFQEDEAMLKMMSALSTDDYPPISLPAPSPNFTHFTNNSSFLLEEHWKQRFLLWMQRLPAVQTCSEKKNNPTRILVHTHAKKWRKQRASRSWAHTFWYFL